MMTENYPVKEYKNKLTKTLLFVKNGQNLIIVHIHHHIKIPAEFVMLKYFLVIASSFLAVTS